MNFPFHLRRQEASLHVCSESPFSLFLTLFPSPQLRVSSSTPDFFFSVSHFNFMIFSALGSSSDSPWPVPHLWQNSKEVVICCRRRDWNIPAQFSDEHRSLWALKHKEMGQGRFVTKSWRRKSTEIIFLTPKKPHCCPTTEISRAAMFRESISVCSEDANQTNSICQLCRMPYRVALQHPSAYV
jgi:hypothetical protein